MMDLFADTPTPPAAQLHRITWFIGGPTVSFDLECLHEELPARFVCDKDVADEEPELFIEYFAGERAPLRDGVIESHWTGSGEDAELWWKYATGPVADAAKPAADVTAERLSQMEARLNAAGNQPWLPDTITDYGSYGKPEVTHYLGEVARTPYGNNTICLGPDKETADFLRHSREDLRAALAGLTAARAVAEQWRAKYNPEATGNTAMVPVDALLAAIDNAIAGSPE